MNALIAAVRELAGYDRRSPALLVFTPESSYQVRSRGYGGSTADIFVISRDQLHQLMAAKSLRREHLTDPETARRLAAVVAEFHRRRTGHQLP